MEEKNLNNEETNYISNMQNEDINSSKNTFGSIDDGKTEISDITLNEVDSADTPTSRSTAEEELITDIPEAAYAFRWDYGEQKRYDSANITPKKKSRGALTYAIILSVTLILSFTALAGVILLGDYLNPNGYSKPSMEFADEMNLNALYEHCLPSYVAVSVTNNSGSKGAGSGIIITSDGYISTNYHVVEDTKEITVILSDGSRHTAQYIDGDEINDIAVIKISANGLTPAKLGNSDGTKVGERVMAIGTPYSISYAGSMTAGYISGIDRLYREKNENGTVSRTLKLLQTDTSVNPGNSGGPLFNMNGEVIGVVTMKIAGSEYEGMGFAIPINGVKAMIFDIIENGEITDSSAGSATEGAALGISGHAVEGSSKYLLTDTACYPVKSDEFGEYLELQYAVFPYTIEKIYLTDTDALEEAGITNWTPYTAPCTGVLIRGTSDGFDSKDKLLEFDIIASANGVECDSMETLQELIFNSNIGDKLQLKVFRNGEMLDIEVELGCSNSME